MAERINGFNDRDTARVGRSVRTTERMGTPSLGGSSDSRRDLVGWLLVKIISSTSLGKNQWEYTVAQVKKGDKYTITSTGDTLDTKAYNYWEVGNDASTATVNGVDIDSSVTGLKPVPNGKLVRCIVDYDTNNKPEYWFALPNEWNVDCRN